jgi:hypothetical protein
MRRRLLLLALVAAWAPSTAHAGDVPPATLGHVLATEHFVVHYSTESGDPDAISDNAAAQLAANAERAYAAEVEQWGFPRPADDGDRHVDIYVYVFNEQNPANSGRVVWWSAGVSIPTRIYLAPRYATSASDIAHELFHVLQQSVWAYSGRWVMESTARWAEHELAYKGAPSGDYDFLSHPEAPLDCVDDGCPNGSWDGGYGRWLFWSFLRERFGRDAIRSVFEYGRSEYFGAHLVPGPADALDGALRARGSSLSRAYGEFAVANAAKTYGAVVRSGRSVPTTPMFVGTTRVFGVEHLAARYVELRRAAGCRTTTLQVRVSMPSADVGVPTLVVAGVPHPLRVSPGGAASLDFTWDSCGPTPVLVLPNTGLRTRSEFAVSAVAADVGATRP